MQDTRKTKAQLMAELTALRQRVAELETQAHPTSERAAWPAEPTVLPRGDLFRALVEASPDAITLTDLSGHITFANEQTARLHGRATPGELIGTVVYELIAPQHRQQISQVVRQALTGRVARISEAELLRQDGSAFWADLAVTVLRDVHGQPTALIGITRDITERQNAEAEVQRLNAQLEQRVLDRTAELNEVNTVLQNDIRQRQRVEDLLRRSEQRYRTLFESAADAIFIFTISGQILEANRSACERYLYTRDEMQQLTIAEIQTPDQRQFVPMRLAQTRQQGFNRFETTHQRRDGTAIPVDVNSRVIEYGGQPAILSIIRDITERQQAEQALQRYATEQAALYQTALLLSAQLDVQALLRLIVEQAANLLNVSAGGVYLHDRQRDLLMLAVGLDYFANYVGTELGPGEGASGRAFQQRAVLILTDYQVWEGRAAIFPPDERVQAVIAAPLLGRHAPLGVLFLASGHHQQRFDDHDRQLVELFAAEAATALENAQFYEQQQEQYRRLQEAQVRLIQAEKMSALGRLIASISHEINNPLQAIQGCLTLVREGLAETPGLDDEAATNWQHDLEIAATEVQRIASIVQRLRDFYRPARASWQSVDVVATLNLVLALAGKQLQHSRISLEQVTGCEQPFVIHTNADQLKQVFLNLVLNAIDAMPHGGRLHVAVQPNDHDTGVRIEVSDNGHGIPAANLPHIFEPFFTTKDNGSGLGLAISYELVKALGGELTVTTQEGIGTTFTIYLPLLPSHASEVTA